MATISSGYKTKVIFILGATGTGKSKLAISLAKRCTGEIINSDKIQVYDAIPVITNRVSKSDISTVPHHLLAFLPPDAEYCATDFINHCIDTIAFISSRKHLPIIAGGSNSYIKALVEDPKFIAAHECCSIWLDAKPDILNCFVSCRVESMMQQGLIEEAQSLFDPENSDYSKGVKRAIGIPEMDAYFRVVSAGSDKDELERILKAAVSAIKTNTCKLVCRQVEKIQRFRENNKGRIYRIDVSEVLTSKLSGISNAEENDLWEQVVAVPSYGIVKVFLGLRFENQFESKIINCFECNDTATHKLA